MLLGNLRELNEEIMLIEVSDKTSKVSVCSLADGCYYINRTNCEAGLGHPLVSVGLLKYQQKKSWLLWWGFDVLSQISFAIPSASGKTIMCFLSGLACGDSALSYFTVPIWHSLVTNLNQPVAGLPEPQVGAVLSQAGWKCFVEH